MFSQFKDKYEFYCLGENDEIIPGIENRDVSFIEDGEMAMVNALVSN